MSALRRLVVATSFAALGCTTAEPQPVTQPAPPEQEEELALEPLTGIWSEVAPLAAPRSGFATAVTEASVLVAGGLESEAPSASLSHYDPEIGEIGLGALPAPAFGAAAFVRDDVFFIVGGIASTNASPIVPNDTCHRWAEGALAPCATIGNGPTSHAAAVTADGYGYLVGGLRLIEPASGSFPTMVVQRLDLAADEWRAETHLPEFRDGAATFVHGGKLFVVGGRTLDQQTGQVSLPAALLRYDLETYSWDEAAPLPTPRVGLACALRGDEVICVGGYDAGGTALDAVERYDPTSDSWSSLPPLPAARYGAQAVARSEGVMILGGTGPDGFDATNVFLLE